LLVKNNYYNMKHIKKFNENLSKLRTGETGGRFDEQILIRKINELISEIEELKRRVDELESK
jgi:hypothetical protein